MARAPLPDFLIIGAQKSATRWLRTALGEHPEVFTAPRELEFFNHNFNRGVRWYVDQFQGWDGEAHVGEATPGYMFWRESPRLQSARVKGLIPSCRLFAVLRNPVDRARSAFIHHIRQGRIPPEAELVSWIGSVEPAHDKLGIISGGWYAASLRPYQRRFGPSLRVLLHDDIEDDPNRIYEEACSHLGATPGFIPPSLKTHRNRGADALAEERPEAPVLCDDEGYREELYRYFADDIRDLESMFGLNLSAWKIP